MNNISNLIIRQEQSSNYFQTEAFVEAAFRNEACLDQLEHFLAHKLRQSLDFVPEFFIITELNGEITGMLKNCEKTVLDLSGFEN
jgi:predicted N-acetyltransferase YhbS